MAHDLAPKEFSRIQKDLGWTDEQVAEALALKGEHAARTVRHYKLGEKPISGPVACAMLAFAQGFTPRWFGARNTRLQRKISAF